MKSSGYKLSEARGLLGLYRELSFVSCGKKPMLFWADTRTIRKITIVFNKHNEIQHVTVRGLITASNVGFVSTFGMEMIPRRVEILAQNLLAYSTAVIGQIEGDDNEEGIKNGTPID
mgnify:CR=1 FL=1|nr:MAG TPA: hypothetical protein [Caudoviricetes sp.]